MARWHGIWGFKYSARYSSFMSSVLFSVVPEPSKLGYQSVFHLLQCKMQLGPYKLILEHLKLEYYVQYPNSLSVGINVYWLHLLQCKMQLGPYRLILEHLKLEYCVQYPSSLSSGINLYWPHLLQCKMQLGPYRLILVHLKLEYCVWYPSSLNLSINLYLAQWFLMPIESKLFFFGTKILCFFSKVHATTNMPPCLSFFHYQAFKLIMSCFFLGKGGCGYPSN